MSVRTYLPSAQFLVIIGALAVSGGVVAAAQYYVSAKNAPASLASAQGQALDQAWAQSLEQIQAQSGVALPEAPSGDAIQNLLTQAQSGNLTDSIGRQLLVRLTSAGVQGLGSDIPTQDSIIAEAAAQINVSQSAPKSINLSLVESSDLTLRSYGNATMVVFGAHPKASSADTLLTLAKATDTGDPVPLAAMATIGAEYRAMADGLSALAVPKTLSPLHLQAVQNLYRIADTYPDLAQVVEDPLRGIAALQRYQLLMGETGRVLTNIAEALQKGGILFSKDEPGSVWETFLSAP
jgi:protein-tyrosine-phosphatase